MKPDGTTLIDTSLNCFRAELPAGSRAILFGSYARGDARADSDLDWLVVEREVPDRAAEMVRLSSLLGQLLIPADVVVMSRETFDAQCRVPNTLAWRAQSEGREFELAD